MFSVPCVTGQAGSFYTAAGGCEREERAGSSVSLSRALVGACASSAESLRRGCGQAEVTAVSPAGLKGGGRRGGGEVGRQAESVRWESAQEESLVAVLGMESPRLLLPSLFGSVLLFLFFSADLSECVTISSTDQTIVTKAQGDKVTLMCKFSLSPQDEGQLDIEWVMVQPDTEDAVILYNTGKIYDIYHMSGRVRFIDPIPSSGDGSIEILNLKPTDSGTYQCKVKKLPGIDTHRVQLTVLEKPSKTRCYIQGSQEIGTDVTLKCTSQAGSPVITYNWIKTTTDADQLPVTSKLNSDTGDLLVKNASQIYSGTYKCVSSNRVGTDECSVVLNITPPMNRAGTIAGAVIGTLLGLLLLAFFIFCCFKKRREKKYEKEVHHDIREDVPPPKSRASTARSYIGSNRSSLGSMSPSNMDGYAKTQYNKVPIEDFERAPAQNPNFPPPKVAAPNLSRMGAIPVMIPAQSKDGSIV